MKRYVKQLYYMSLSRNTQTPIRKLVINVNTGGVFNMHVITEYMMRDYLTVQQFIDSVYARQINKRSST